MKGLIALLLVTLFTRSGDLPDRAMREAAKAFLAALPAALKEKAVQPLHAPALTKWAYVPGPRPGVSWAELDRPQRSVATALLRTALGEAGWHKAEVIRRLEDPLREMENGNPGRDPLRYWFVFFGDPEGQGPWAWRYEGHHLSLTFACSGGRVTATTPQFLGSNPAKVAKGPTEGTRALAKEQDQAFDFLQTLTEDQRKKAILSERAPNDIVTAAVSKVELPERKGLAFSELGERQRACLLALIAAHAEIQRPEVREERLRQAKDDADAIVFAWLGPLARSGRHYYRIQAKTWLIEYDCTQDDGNHIHTVWRDLEHDFGGDPLADHYRESHRHR